MNESLQLKPNDFLLHLQKRIREPSLNLYLMRGTLQLIRDQIFVQYLRDTLLTFSREGLVDFLPSHLTKTAEMEWDLMESRARQSAHEIRKEKLQKAIHDLQSHGLDADDIRREVNRILPLTPRTNKGNTVNLSAEEKDNLQRLAEKRALEWTIQELAHRVTRLEKEVSVRAPHVDVEYAHKRLNDLISNLSKIGS